MAVSVAWRILDLLAVSRLLQRQAGRCAACKTVFDPDLELGDNTNVVVRRGPATRDTTRVLVHRWCRPERSPRSTSHALADA